MVADPGSPEGGGQLCIMLLPNPTQVSLEDMPSLACWRSSQDALQRKKVAVPVTAPPPLTAISHIVVAIPAHPQLPWIRAYWWCPPHPGPSPGHWQIFRRVCHLPAEMLAHPLPPSSPRSPCTKSPCPLTHSPHRSNCRGTDNGAVLISTIPGHLRPVSPGARTMQL